MLAISALANNSVGKRHELASASSLCARHRCLMDTAIVVPLAVHFQEGEAIRCASAVARLYDRQPAAKCRGVDWLMAPTYTIAPSVFFNREGFAGHPA